MKPSPSNCNKGNKNVENIVLQRQTVTLLNAMRFEIQRHGRVWNVVRKPRKPKRRPLWKGPGTRTTSVVRNMGSCSSQKTTIASSGTEHSFERRGFRQPGRRRQLVSETVSLSLFIPDYYAPGLQFHVKSTDLVNCSL